MPQDCTPPEARTKVALLVNTAIQRFPNGVPLLDPINDLGIKDDAFQTLIERAEALATRLSSHKLAIESGEKERREMVHTYEQKVEKLEQARLLRLVMSTETG
jgi:ATP-dependent RNA helicase DOB1